MSGGKGTDYSRRANFVGPLVDPDLDEFGAEGIGDLVFHLVAANHPYLAIVHGAERIGRRAFRLPLAIFLNRADAERIECPLDIERTIALRGLRARRLPQ